MKIVVKQISTKDLSKYYAFFKKSVGPLFPEYNKEEVEFIITKGWTKERLSKSLKDKRKILLAAFNGNKIVGIMDTDTPFMGVAFGVWLMVDKKFQKQGIGKKLLEEFEKTVKKTGGHSVYLYSGNKNMEYYKQRGYEYVGVHRKAWLGQDHYYFAKQIAEPKEENYLKSGK